MVGHLLYLCVILKTDILAGAHSWVRKAMAITMDGEQTGKLYQQHYDRMLPSH